MSKNRDSCSANSSQVVVLALVLSLILYCSPMTAFKALFNPDCPAKDNMGIDREMMGSDIPFLRVYTWTPDAISLGFSQGEDVVDMDECRKSGIEVVTRFTGGAAVFHKDEVTYSFFYPASIQPKYSAREMRKAFMEVFLKVFSALDVPAEGSANEKWEMPASAVCFHAAAENEIIVAGKKIVGSAQSVKRAGIFQHGSIVLKPNEELFCKLVPGAEAKDVMAGVWEYNPDVTPVDVYRLMTDAVQSVFGFDDPVGDES